MGKNIFERVISEVFQKKLGEIENRKSWGKRTWKVAQDKGAIRPAGGLTRNLWGEEVWTLKATWEVAQSDLRRTLARHLVLGVKSMRTSGSETSTRLSIERRRDRRESEDDKRIVELML